MRLDLEGLEFEALVLLGEVIKVHLSQLVRDVIHVRAAARGRYAVHERHLLNVCVCVCVRVARCYRLRPLLHTRVQDLGSRVKST